METDPQAGQSLDPVDWPRFRSEAHQMLDDILDFQQNIRRRPVWQPVPAEVRERFHARLPFEPSDLSEVHGEFLRSILPYGTGNVHPGFMGWVHGGGTPVGMMADMLAAGMNANLGGRDHIALEVERQIVRWMASLFGFPPDASGLFVTGTSLANFISLAVARDAAAGFQVRKKGIASTEMRLTAYASAEAHSCLGKAMDLSGLGSDSLRAIPTDDQYRIDVESLRRRIAVDRAAGLQPFFVAGTAGTVSTGACDDLLSLANLCHQENLWFHVDGAFGALAVLAPELAGKIRGIESADSLAFDFHKWGQVPYDAGFVLVRNRQLHRNAFSSVPSYLERQLRGLGGGDDWPCDFGPDLSRGFRALKTWFTLKVFGLHALGEVIQKTCCLARDLEKRILREPELELLAPVEFNIVCFRYRSTDGDRVNQQILVSLQESGIAAPSSAILRGRFAIRVAVVNHRTERGDLHVMVDHVLLLGRQFGTFLKEKPPDTAPCSMPAFACSPRMAVAQKELHEHC